MKLNMSVISPWWKNLKRDFPHLKIAIHTALTDEASAKRMESAGVDTAMMDVIGAQETIKQVYKLDRPVADFEATLAAHYARPKWKSVRISSLVLHYGQLLGEANALDICARYDIQASGACGHHAVLLQARHLRNPKSTTDVGRIFLEARKRMGDTQSVLLGCARPAGMHKRVTDAYAVMAGLDGIAFPADGALASLPNDRP